MPSCQKHLQHYNQDEYCVYCGVPLAEVSTNINPIINPIPVEDLKLAVDAFWQKKLNNDKL